MADLSASEKATIAAVVDGLQRREQRRRRAARQGWAFLLTGALSVPIIASALAGLITVPTAMMRIGVALVITTTIVSLAGSLLDSYQSQAAVKTVEAALQEARAEAARIAAADGDGDHFDDREDDPGHVGAGSPDGGSHDR